MRNTKRVHRRGAEDAEEGKGSEGGDLRARMVGLDKNVHALAKGVTGLTVTFFPSGAPGLRIVTASQEYVVEVDANWTPRGARAKAPKWRRLAEAKDALMTVATAGLAQLIEQWKATIARHDGGELGRAQKRMDELDELLKC